MKDKTVVKIFGAVMILFAVFVVIMLVVTHGLGINISSQKPLVTSTTTSVTSTTTTTNLGNGMQVVGPAGSKITVVTSKSVAAPNLEHSVNYSTNLSPEVVSKLAEHITSRSAALKKNPARGELWLQLGFDYKIAGDLPAAEAVWVYMTKIAPQSQVAFIDLGDLYQNFLKDYPKSEANYLAAVKLDPTNIDLYRNLYMLYKYQYKTNTTAAANILTQGLKANPNNPDLLTLQKQ